MTNPELQVTPAAPQAPQNTPDKTIQDLVDLLDAAYKTYRESLPRPRTPGLILPLTRQTQTNAPQYHALTPATQSQTQTAPGTQFSQALVNINIMDDQPDMEIWDQWVARAVSNNEIRLTTMFKPASAGSLLLVAMPYAVWMMMPEGDANFTLIHLFS
ncbi:hypothetical protein ASPVEDRAFT_888793 [Aspergillus versicolor CBS 583.65]|uniref:Uncharacterized protein n=1 Tax=Aspergillus versicolor CBS 583.65 TaxID=1036611 RepID=A0A1L9PMH9_ASPVE|nr:uncharacterized protein ASPVEDRAFT_888793 [Aspergillus versicolor CBS 583.65]OJJ02693.1 hypothetical protein ASPVEDRAFT_888793 [Aspergillus versicolor CBS 583.65]